MEVSNGWKGVCHHEEIISADLVQTWPGRKGLPYPHLSLKFLRFPSKGSSSLGNHEGGGTWLAGWLDIGPINIQHIIYTPFK
jgi:hypothetical protein